MVLEINNIIVVENLCRNFNGFTALQDVNLTVKEGEIFTYLGPNGAGKSTTINILVTLLKPSSGRVHIAGFDVKKQSVEIRKLIGYFQEDSTLYPLLTFFENLNFSIVVKSCKIICDLVTINFYIFLFLFHLNPPLLYLLQYLYLLIVYLLSGP